MTLCARAHRLALALALLACAMTAAAHSPSDAFVSLRVEGAQVSGQWEIALRDLALIEPLDADGNRELSWGELRAAEPALLARLPQFLHLNADGAPCPLRLEPVQIHDRVDGRFAWFDLEAQCPRAPRELGIEYTLLFELDPTHRGIANITADSATHSAVLAPDSGPRRFELAAPSVWAAFRDYLREGVWHIWIGYDHILFLLALLLPAVLRFEHGRWEAQPRLGPALREVIGVVTAFTLAHSVTLTLAALELVRLPIAAVEAAIAASVVVAALNNLRPLVARSRWTLAFAFGLIHGFGFASVLGELGLPQDARLIALLAFNLGVELGQIAIVAVAVPLAFTLRRTRFYNPGVRVIGSAAVALLALWWLGQRLGMLPE